MIPVNEIRQRARTWALPEETIEKDYVLGWVLWGIVHHPVLSVTWVFRGGTCLKKCYVDTHRYSEDLDFTVLEGGTRSADELLLILQEVLQTVTSASGIDFSVRTPQLKLLPHGKAMQGKVYYQGPRHAPTPAAIKLDIVFTERVVRPPVLRAIRHPYSDMLPEPNRALCYNLEELFAEKVRALGERCRPRDLYDVIYLFRRSDLHAEPELMQTVLERKCKVKGIVVPTYDSIATSSCRSEMEAEWGNMLGHQLGRLPVFDDFWTTLPTFFAWLNGTAVPDEVQIVSLAKGEMWEPPAVEWQRGQENLLEPIRFAAVNRLLLLLGYQGSTRAIEPYSLRSTQDGFILLYALRADNKGLRSYRLDQIQSIEVTQNPFRPTFLIEFTPQGRFSAPLTVRRQSLRTRSTGIQYVVECSYCGRRFRRSKFNLRIKPHKQKRTDSDCPGRHGYLIDTYYG